MRRIVAFTGAGISKASGIPTFQDVEGIRDKLSIDYFTHNPEDFYDALTQMKTMIAKAAPNAAHRAIAEYDIPVVTMNIDGLHRRAGSKELVEIHGNLDEVSCIKCGKRYDFDYTAESIHCQKCNGLLKPNVVLYGEMIPKYREAIEMIDSADELLVVGTSFYTSTSTDMVGRARWEGVKVTVINSNAENQVPEYLEKVLGQV